MYLCRTDISPALGVHRFHRCIILGLLLRQYGGVEFAIEGDKLGRRLLQARGFSLVTNFMENKSTSRPLRCVIFDTHQPNPKILGLLHWAKGKGISTVQFVDVSSECMDVDLVISPGLGTKHNLEKGGKLLQGPEFVPLHHKYRHFFKVRRKYNKTVRKILVALGSTTSYRILRDVIDQLDRHQFQLKVAPGFYLKKSFRKVLKRLYPKVHFVGNTESLARSFFEADAACIAAGQAVYEAAVTGTPAVYLAKDDSQCLLAKTAENQGLGVFAGSLIPSTLSDIPAKITALSPHDRETMGQCGKNLVDGLGVYRIIDFFRDQGIIN